MIDRCAAAMLLPGQIPLVTIGIGPLAHIGIAHKRLASQLVVGHRRHDVVIASAHLSVYGKFKHSPIHFKKQSGKKISRRNYSIGLAVSAIAFNVERIKPESSSGALALRTTASLLSSSMTIT